jgi:hypothetical protein
MDFLHAFSYPRAFVLLNFPYDGFWQVSDVTSVADVPFKQADT